MVSLLAEISIRLKLKDTYLAQMRVGTLAFSFRISNHHFHAREKLKNTKNKLKTQQQETLQTLHNLVSCSERSLVKLVLTLPDSMRQRL